jgi:hypothetical protein
MILNNELKRMWKEAILVCSGICLERLRNTTKTFSQNTPVSCQRFESKTEELLDSQEKLFTTELLA